MKNDDWIIRPEDVLPALLAMIADKGPRRRTKAEIQKWRRTWERNKRRRQAEALKRNRKARGRRAPMFRRPLGESYVDRMLAAMEPGEWYGRLDIVRFVEGERYLRGKINQVMVPYGLIERARNPAWRGVVSPQKIFAGTVPEPQWVYRLTARGAMRGELVRMVA